MGGIHRHESSMDVFEAMGKIRKGTKIQKGKIHAIKHSCILFCFLIVTQYRMLIACASPPTTPSIPETLEIRINNLNNQ